jgi:hypothetical protein
LPASLSRRRSGVIERAFPYVEEGVRRNVRRREASPPSQVAILNWLLDEIALVQRYEKRVAGEEFQFWKIDGEGRPDRDAHLRRRKRQQRFFQADRIHGFSVAGDRALFHQPPTISLMKKRFDSAGISWCKNQVQKKTLSRWQG